MDTYIKKIQHILPTFLVVTLGTVFGLGLIRWLLCFQFKLIDINEEIWVFWLPIIFPWLPIFIWLRKRFRILTFEKDNDKGRLLFQVLSWLIMTAMLMNLQDYLTTSTGKLKKISTIQEIDKYENYRYYKLKKFAVAPHFAGAFKDVRRSGKFNEYLNYEIYFTIPILKDTNEKILVTPKYWYGIKYKLQISNKASNEDKEKILNAYYLNCIEEMSNYDFHSLDHFERKPKSEEREKYLNAIENRTKQKYDGNFIVLEPVHERFENRNGDKLAWVFASFVIGLGMLLFFLKLTGYSEEERMNFLAGRKPNQDDLVNTLNYLIPQGDHFVTSIFINLNIFVFILMIISGIHVFSPNGIELLQWGANRRFEIINGEWWRLLTSMFLHGGIKHLLLNISGLVIAAIFIEPLLGRKKYFILYILSGVCGSLASISWYTNSISVGASGAIFGLYGALLGLLLTNAFPEEGKKRLLTLIGIYVAINLLWGLTGGIDNAAHIGGLLSGALIGTILYKHGGKQKT